MVAFLLSFEKSLDCHSGHLPSAVALPLIYQVPLSKVISLTGPQSSELQSKDIGVHDTQDPCISDTQDSNEKCVCSFILQTWVARLPEKTSLGHRRQHVFLWE